MAIKVQKTAESPVLLPVSEDPFCRETALTSLDTWITPTERFYIRHHFSEIPDLDARSWRLTVDGHVQNPFSLTLADILALPSKEMVVTLECAGNSRSYLSPPAEGLAFKHGAISTARWKGVSLSVLLDRAGIKEGAQEVVFRGTDYGEEEERGEPLALAYGRSLPLAKALDADTLLAYEMNGKPLTRHHGYPLRAIVPGWYGMASVKWLVQVQVWEAPFDGFFQDRRYVYIKEGAENSSSRVPVTTLKVKSLVTAPRHGEVIRRGLFKIQGFAWSGEGRVEKVDVSTNGGRSWKQAKLLGESHPYAWRQWELDWQATQPGHFIIMARAGDSAGNVQPKNTPWNFRGYANNSIHTIAVEVPV